MHVNPSLSVLADGATRTLALKFDELIKHAPWYELATACAPTFAQRFSETATPTLISLLLFGAQLLGRLSETPFGLNMRSGRGKQGPDLNRARN